MQYSLNLAVFALAFELMNAQLGYDISQALGVLIS